MTNYAVLIGNSEFPNEPTLKPLICPPFDVDGLKNVLTAENRGQFLAENITILVNQPSNKVTAAINRILKNATKDDLILLYYSGHGKTDHTGNDLYLTTLNTTDELLESSAVSFEQIYTWINRFYCKKFIIILDCCFSGTAGKVFRSDIGEQLQSLNNAATGTFLITSTTNDKVAVDKTADSQFSLFTKHLIRGLESDEADENGDGKISIDELFRYVSKKVTGENPNQKPKRFVKNETGEMIIGKSGRNSRKELADEIKRYFAGLFADDLIEIDTLQTVSQLIYKSQFSELERQQYDLVVEVFKSKKLAGFERRWHNLVSQPVILKPEPPLIITPSKTVVEPPATWQCPITGMEFVWIKSGTFMMGSPETEKGRYDDERQHQVTIETSFYLGKYLVTQAQWQQVMGNNPSKFKGDNLPVETVSWNDVQDFLEKLNANNGKLYRLPTEAEWEYACRAGTTTAYYTGDTLNHTQANFDNKVGKTTNVGSYPANPWGLYDMTGNVWEWTCSDYSENYDGNEMCCSSNISLWRVLRGGSWFINCGFVRSAVRDWLNPDVRDFNIGFRLALGQ